MSKKRTVSKTRAKSAAASTSPYKGVVFPAIWGAIALLLCLMIFSYFLTNAADPDKFIPALCLVSIAISGAVCGIVCKKICGCKSALSIVAGLMIVGILLIASLLSKDVCESSVVYKSAIIILCPVTSFITCSLGKSTKKRTR